MNPFWNAEMRAITYNQWELDEARNTPLNKKVNRRINQTKTILRELTEFCMESLVFFLVRNEPDGDSALAE